MTRDQVLKIVDDRIARLNDAIDASCEVRKTREAYEFAVSVQAVRFLRALLVDAYERERQRDAEVLATLAAKYRREDDDE